MFFRQYQLSCLSLFSYLIGDTATGRAVVVDPQRDITGSLDDARATGLAIERVIETHFHADFLSGHLELAAATEAVISYGTDARAEFPIEPLAHGQRIERGEVVLEVRHTPGHTPESISVVVWEHASDAVPWGVFTGDALSGDRSQGAPGPHRLRPGARCRRRRRLLADRPDLAAQGVRLAARDLASWRDEKPNLQIIDVRNPSEHESGVVPGAIRVPLARLLDRLGDLDATAPTVVYCAAGYRSSIAASLLRTVGFTQVADLQGGYDAWAAAGLPTVTPETVT
jgi:rhodanese-related sulfurtransferase